jgi:hypothetical protein
MIDELDEDAFLVRMYVLLDDFCLTPGPQGGAKLVAQCRGQRGPAGALSASEVVCLALLGQHRRWPSERAFYRWAQQHLRPYFPTLPTRSQFLRQARRYYPLLAACQQHLAALGGAAHAPYQALDTTAVPVRALARRGTGWLAGQANVGHSSRYGTFCGFQLLAAVTPTGLLTGFALAPAATNERPLADDFLRARHAQLPGLPCVGRRWVGGLYVGDKGFCAFRSRWPALARDTGQHLLTAPARTATAARQWSPDWRAWLARRRQIVETVFDKLHHEFNLSAARARPHEVGSLLGRLAAKCGLHNLLLYFNLQLGRPPLAFADLFPF